MEWSTSAEFNLSDAINYSLKQHLNTNFWLFSADSSEMKYHVSFPVNKIKGVRFNISLVYLFYKKTPNLATEKIVKSEKSSANDHRITIFMDSLVKVKIISLSTVNFSDKSQSKTILINPENAPHTILSYIISETNEQLKKRNNEDKLLINILKHQLESSKIQFLQLSQFLIEFQIPNSKQSRPSVVRAKICKGVLKLIFQCFFLASNDLSYNTEKFDRLLEETNSNLNYGRFYRGSNLLFTTSYSVTENCKLVSETYQLAKDVWMKLQNILGRFELELTSRCFDLNAEQVEQEEQIKARLDDYRENNFMLNRFRNNYINIKKGNSPSIRYSINPNALSLQFCLEDDYEGQYTFYIDLIAQLSKLQLFFKGNQLKLEDFGFANEKIIYLYNKRLSDVLEFEPNISEERIVKRVKKTEKNLRAEIVKYHRKNLEKRNESGNYTIQEFNQNFKNFTKIMCGRSSCKKWYEQSLNNPNPYTLEFFGYVYESEAENFLFCDHRIQGSLLDFLKNEKKIMELKDTVLKVFHMIEGILVRNSSIRCFDLDCILIREKGTMILIPKIKEDVDMDFWAPELKKGRATSKSLIYSFGVAIKYICTSLVHRFGGDWKRSTEIPIQLAYIFPDITNIIKACCEESPIKRISRVKLRESITNV